ARGADGRAGRPGTQQRRDRRPARALDPHRGDAPLPRDAEARRQRPARPLTPSSATAAITAIIAAPAKYAAATPSVGLWKCATIAPSTAMPTTPPTWRTVWAIPLAWLRSAAGAAPSASVVAGEIVIPMPMPMTT